MRLINPFMILRFKLAVGTESFDKIPNGIGTMCFNMGHGKTAAALVIVIVVAVFAIQFRFARLAWLLISIEYCLTRRHNLEMEPPQWDAFHN